MKPVSFPEVKERSVLMLVSTQAIDNRKSPIKAKHPNQKAPCHMNMFLKQVSIGDYMDAVHLTSQMLSSLIWMVACTLQLVFINL
jgi:hypothetical protein